MNLKSLSSLVVAGLFALSVRGEIPCQPYAMDWSKAAESAVDLSSFLQAPAGQGGFIRVKGEHLVKPDGKRFRIWGVNLCGSDCFPSHEEAVLLAGDLARMGVNCVRFHHMEATWGSRNIFNAKLNHTRELDPASLERLDFLIAELKKRGIYANLNLNVSRRFKAGDEVRDYQLLGYAKSATYFNERLMELQHEYARQLLTHKNAYTGNEYRNELAVAVVEMVNENSVLEGWVGWRLVGKDDPKADTWSPLPVSYAEELTDKFNDWLKRNVSAEQLAAIRTEAGVGADGRVPRLMPNQFAKASKERFQAEARFYMEVERKFFEGMKKLLKEELGVKAMLVGTADHNDGYSAYAHIDSNTIFDIVDGHGYWEHPNIGATTWCKNTPMVNDPLDSTFTQFARTPVAGKPFTISEVNHPFPHEYACEGFPILTAYALFHDWDGIYWFTWGLGRKGKPQNGIQYAGWFDISNDPVKMANLYACALMWHRQDLREAKQTIIRSYPREHLLESLRMARKESPFFTTNFARSTPLQHKTRFTLDGSRGTRFPPAAPLGQIESDTKELGWYNADRTNGVVAVDAERTQALIGFVKTGGKSVKHLSAEVENDFCALERLSKLNSWMAEMC